MSGGAWRSVLVALALAGLTLGYLGTEVGRLVGDDRMTLYLDLAAVGIGVLALWSVFVRLGRHIRDLERLRDDIAGVRGRADAPAGWGAGRDDPVGRLAQAVADLLRRVRGGPGRAGERLAGVVAAVEEPVLVLDEVGRVEAANAAASRVLDLVAGADVYDVLSRPELFRAIERARESGQTVSAVLRRSDGPDVPARIKDLGFQAGVVLVLPLRGTETLPRLTGERALPRPPGRAPRTGQHLGDEEPLVTLPMVALWVATTEPEDGGSVVAVGTVRLAGARVFRTVSLDLLVDPGGPVSAEATAVHGVGTAMVEGARPFAEVWPVVADALRGCVVVGIGVEAALAALARGCVQAGLPEPDLPPWLDLGRLAAVLDPALQGAGLDRLAGAFGVERPAGPAPLSPVMAEAELAAAVIARLERNGVTTHGQARAAAGAEALPQRSEMP